MEKVDTTKPADQAANIELLANLLATGGLILRGLVLKSEKKEGVTRDTKKPWAAVETTVLAGDKTVIWSQFQEQDKIILPHKLHKAVTVNVSGAKMDGRHGIIVNGDLVQ
jgi:hypothetical protein